MISKQLGGIVQHVVCVHLRGIKFWTCASRNFNACCASSACSRSPEGPTLHYTTLQARTPSYTRSTPRPCQRQLTVAVTARSHK